MARRDIAGLLTGIPSSGGGSFAEVMTQGARQMGGLMGRYARGAVTGDSRSNEQRLADSIKNFDSATPEAQKDLIGRLQASGESSVAAQLLGQLKENKVNQATDQRRENMIAQSNSLGLKETSTLLTDGGSLDKGAEDIRKAQEANILKKQGRKGKVAIANSRNVGASVLKAIGQGEYDSLSSEDFLKVLSGEKAQLKVYTDSSGQAKPFRVNESGKVYNKDTEKWVMPSELGLTQAAQLTRTITDADRISSKLRDKATDNFLAANEKALGAQKVLEINANSRSLMEEGIITGAGADFLLGMASIGVQLGLVPQGIEDDLIATQTFMAERGKQVLALLGSGDVGAGTGISDKDVQFMKEVAGQQITLNKETLARIMSIEEQVARDTIAKSNSRLEVMKKYVGEDQDSALLDTFFVPLPPPSSQKYEPSDLTNKYLQEARQRTQNPPRIQSIVQDPNASLINNAKQSPLLR
jgi:hypothetical protein